MSAKRRRGLQFMDVVELLAEIGFKFGGLALALVVGYLLFGLFSGSLAQSGSYATAERLRIVWVVHTGCKLVGILGLLFTFGVVVRFRQEEGVGYVLAIVGFVLVLGISSSEIPVIPRLLPSSLQPNLVNRNEAVITAMSQMRFLGLTFLIPGVVLSIRDLLEKVRGLWSKKPTGRVVWGEEQKRNPPIYGSCWDMVFCREFIRSFCPAYEAGKACWKVKVGCYCDERTILQALKYQGSGNSFAKEVALNVDSPHQRKLTAAQKRQRCRSCMLFLEHQRQKYQLLTPIVMVGVGVLMWRIYPLVQAHFDDFVQATDRFMRTVSFHAQTAAHAETPSYVTGDGSHVIFLLFVIWLSIVVLSYALRALEYCVFKIKI